jgi:hypothetical protein
MNSTLQMNSADRHRNRSNEFDPANEFGRSLP